MVIVSDTSSVSNLIQLNQLHLLNELYGGLSFRPQSSGNCTE